MPDMLKVGPASDNFVHMLMELVRVAWKEKCVPQDWRDAIHLPVPKRVISIAAITGKESLCLV